MDSESTQLILKKLYSSNFKLFFLKGIAKFTMTGSILFLESLNHLISDTLFTTS